jgi:hypothetical protein
MIRKLQYCLTVTIPGTVQLETYGPFPGRAEAQQFAERLKEDGVIGRKYEPFTQMLYHPDDYEKPE